MKKALSLILAMMLVVGLIPASFASDAPPAEGYTYVFSNAAHTGTVGDTDSAFESNYETNLYKHTIATTVEGVSAPWGFVAQSAKEAGLQIAGMGTQANNGLISIYKKDRKVENVITFNPDGTDDAIAVCFEIKVEKSGEFIPTFNYNTFAYAPVVELFLVPKGATAPTNATLSNYVKSLDAKYRIGVADMSDGSSETYRPRMLSAGNYYFIIVLNGAGKNDPGDRTYHYSWPKSFELLPRQKTYIYDFTSNVLSAENAEAVNDAIVAEGNSQDALAFQMLKSPIVDTTKTTEWKFRFSRYVYNNMSEEHCSNISENGMKMYLFATRYYDKTATSGNHNAGIATHAIFEIYVPQPGTYKLKMYNKSADTYGSRTEVNFGPATTRTGTYAYSWTQELYEADANQTLGHHDSSVVHDGTVANPAEEFNITVSSAGKYYVLFATPKEVTNENTETVTASGFTLQTLNLSKIVLEEVVDENATYPGDAEINVNPGNTTATDIAPISNEISALAADTDGEALGVEITQSANSVTAPETFGDYEFLYWAKGLGYKKIVSHNTAYSFNRESEKLWLTAVYRNTKAAAPAKATFYNANGDILATVAIADGTVRTPALTNVSLAGYGTVKGWKYAADGVTYGANEEVTVTGDALFVADYDELNTSIDITATNGTITVEGGKEKPLFGDKVTVTAPLRDGTKLFNYWKKGEEIVCFDREYSFCAWEACTLTAVYSDYIPLADSVRKIILGSVANGAETTYVAEFIGFDGDDVLERGIAFAKDGNANFASINRAVMTQKNLNHLAAVNDIGATSVVGYVIDKDGKVYYSK